MAFGGQKDLMKANKQVINLKKFLIVEKNFWTENGQPAVFCTIQHKFYVCSNL